MTVLNVPNSSIPDSIRLIDLVIKFNLLNLTPEVEIDEIKLSVPAVNRPGLQLSGFYDFFDYDRIQILGRSEIGYLKTLTEKERDHIFKKLFKYKIPCVVITHEQEAFPEMLIHAVINNIPIYSIDWQTSEFMGESIRWLKMKLAPRVTLHGVLMDIYGEGIIIMGESGIGKSETALKLISRGHRLVADDAVEISRISRDTLIGACPHLIQYFTEVRGIGVIDVKQMFGVEAVKPSQTIDMVLILEHYDPNKVYNRMGLEDEYIEILEHKVISNTILIRPGRDIAIICEAAAVNNRQKKMGYNAAKTLNDRLKKSLER